jgi:hypothetical protein
MTLVPAAVARCGRHGDGMLCSDVRHTRQVAIKILRQES